MYEGITPLENREFNSSVGNWTGAITWDPGPIEGRTKIAKITIPALQYQEHAYLSYPYFKPLRGKDNSFSIRTCRRNLIPSIQTMTIAFTDGVYTFTSPLINLLINQFWGWRGFTATIPNDWNTPASQLILEFNFGDVMESYLHIDEASLYAETKIDHLPILGVG